MLNLIVATQAEAEPVIARLKLQKIPATLRCYHTDDVHLIISGIGKCNTATACGWLGYKTLHLDTKNRKPAAWLNFGIAGHLDADIGSAFRAHKITDLATDKVWFPHLLNSSIPSSDLVTVDRPLDHYLPETLHDMEASAFMEAARKFSDAELAQSLKIVSDNATHPITEVNAKLAARLIADNIEHIMTYIETLKSLRDTVTRPEDTISKAILNRWHFSVAQKVRLERLLQRHSVLLGPLGDIPDALDVATSSKEVLSWLQKKADSADSRL